MVEIARGALSNSWTCSKRVILSLFHIFCELVMGVPMNFSYPSSPCFLSLPSCISEQVRMAAELRKR